MFSKPPTEQRPPGERRVDPRQGSERRKFLNSLKPPKNGKSNKNKSK